MAKGCDSSWDFDYKSRVDALVDEGYCSIYSILHHVCSPQYCHRIRFSEIKYCGQKMCFLPTIFLDNGLPVCV